MPKTQVVQPKVSSLSDRGSPAGAVPQYEVRKHLRRPAVEAATGLSRSSIYDMMDRGEFPRPVRIGKRAVAWPENAISEWLSNRPTTKPLAG
jgi:prophage regulatory protein